MCNPVPAVSHVQALTETFLPHLRPAQQRGVAEWVVGVLDAESGCERAVLTALEPLGLPEHATRARLRELLCDGRRARRALCDQPGGGGLLRPLAGAGCWRGGSATRCPWPSTPPACGRAQVVLAISVLYRGSAIPVAWVVLPHRGKGPGCPSWNGCWPCWRRPCPPTMTRAGDDRSRAVEPALVASDHGKRLASADAHPPRCHLRPGRGAPPVGPRAWCPGPGWYWVGAGVAYKEKAKQLPATLLVVWGAGPARAVAAADRSAARRRWRAVGTGCGSGSSWASAPSRASAGTGSAPGAPIPRAWRGTGWCWPSPPCSSLAVGTRLEDAAQRGMPAGPAAPSPRHAPAPARPRRVSCLRPRPRLAAPAGAARHGAGGAPGGCGPRPCRTCPPTSPSSAICRLSRRRSCLIPPPLSRLDGRGSAVTPMRERARDLRLHRLSVGDGGHGQRAIDDRLSAARRRP